MSDTRFLRALFEDFERERQAVELAAIAKDPKAHRDTKLFGPRGLRYTYFQVKTGKTSAVRFCYATTPNAAGYWLTWKETVTKKTGVRENVRGHARRRDARESALKGFENHKIKREISRALKNSKELI